MNNPQHEHLHVAIIGSRPKASDSLRNALVDNGFLVDHDLHLDDVTLKRIYDIDVDAVLVELDESADQKLELLEAILEHSPAPVLFNDADYVEPGQDPANDRRLRTLMQKLRKLGPRPVAAMAAAGGAAAPVMETAPIPEPIYVEAEVEPKPTPAGVPATASAEPAKTPEAAAPPAETLRPAVQPRPGSSTRELPLWILGASLGGPAALREFFAHIPEELQVCFLVVQHIGPSHVDLFASQLRRATRHPVELLGEDSELDRGRVLVAPVEQSIIFEDDGSVVLASQDPGCIYSPCIDSTIEHALATWGEQVNVIIFSGMGNDGERGSRLAADRGCRVWAQDSASCVIDSMPERARSTGAVGFTGAPALLAQRLASLYD